MFICVGGTGSLGEDVSVKSLNLSKKNGMRAVSTSLIAVILVLTVIAGGAGYYALSLNATGTQTTQGPTTTPVHSSTSTQVTSTSTHPSSTSTTSFVTSFTTPSTTSSTTVSTSTSTISSSSSSTSTVSTSTTSTTNTTSSTIVSSTSSTSTHTTTAATTSPMAPSCVVSGPHDKSVAIMDFAFSPSTVTISAGQSVQWTNNDGATHTVTGSGWGSGFLSQGATFTCTFASPGTFNYKCSIHGSMTGKVVVSP